MIRTITLTLALLGVVASADAAPKKVDERTIPAASLDRLDIEHPVGDLDIRGGDVEEVTIRMEARCNGFRCGDELPEVELETRESGSRLVVRLRNLPRNAARTKVDLSMVVPSRMAVDVEQGVGDIRIADVIGSIRVESGVGDVIVRIPEEAVHSIRLECGVGDVDIRGPSRKFERTGFLIFGNEARWSDGRGDSRIEVEVGVGEARVRME